MNRLDLRLLVIEAINEISVELKREDDGCLEEEELDEFSGAGAVAGYTLPLGVSNTNHRKSILNITRRSFGGSSGKNKNR